MSEQTSFANAPIEELVSVLLRQLKRPLKAHGVEINDAQANSLASIAAAGQFTDGLESLQTGLIAVVEESEGILQSWGLSFEKALDVKMDSMPGWESTAEFLELANEKSNAELRITLGAAVLGAFRDLRYGGYLLKLAAGNYGDETDIARRVLGFVSGIDLSTPNGFEQLQQWMNSKR